MTQARMYCDLGQDFDAPVNIYEDFEHVLIAM